MLYSVTSARSSSSLLSGPFSGGKTAAISANHACSAGLLTAGSSYSWRSFHCVCFSNQAMNAAASRGATLASNTIMS